MRCRRASSGSSYVFVSLLLLLSALPALAFRERPRTLPFDQLVRHPATASLATEGRPSDALPAAARAGFDAFRAAEGQEWSAWFDVRSGLPTLVEGRGLPFAPAGDAAGRGLDVAWLEGRARALFDAHPQLLGRWGAQLQLDPEASGRLSDHSWQIAFRQVVDGVPVEGARYEFHVSHGNLVAFGASAWGPVRRGVTPALGAAAARAALEAYLGLGPGEASDLVPPRLLLLPVDPRGSAAAWDGAIGGGLAHALAWRFAFGMPGEPATWTADVSADDGAVLAFWDDTKYDRIKGGVFPVSNDGHCPTGCEQLDWPMPFADYTVDGGPVQYSGDHGLYACETAGATIRSTFVGPYIRVQDNCGAVNQTTTCDEPLDFKSGPGTDCAVPPGSSAGNTHSARSSFYHLNRSMEKGRAWLPDNAWLKSQVTDNVNINSTCNAYWNGSVNFYRSGGGCRNTGEIAGVFVHEWGHGIDQNDGGGYDNPSEAYADVVAFFETRESCIGRGFYMSQNCGGYGNACLNCSGIRDQDWDQRANHTPSTPAGFISTCGGGSGACGKETHCEGYLAGETVWDLAVRDLPASGMDAVSAWQHAEQLFYLSRKGSGGNIYNCSIPNSDGCGAANWFHKFRVADDDDGNLANGTPHAAAIFAAFNRHKIACGNASDASNQNSSTCPALTKPIVDVASGTNSATLSWTAVPGAASYTILRNDIGCDRAQIIVDKVPAPAQSYQDTEIANGFPVYYRVQAAGPNPSCFSAVSDCVTSTAQPFAGTVRFDARTYACAATIGVQVTDGNVGAPSVTVELTSASESTPEVLTLNAIAPGASKYIGSFLATSGPPVHGDGRLSIKNGDALHARYVDADDGAGGLNVPRTDTSAGDCVFPVISNVRDAGTSDRATTIRWSTDEVSDSRILWGPTIPPAQPASGDPKTADHAVGLSGLTSCTTYFYEVRSTDAAGNEARSDNGGVYWRFETLGDFGSGLQSCHQGRVTIDAPVYSCGANATFRLVDQDLNLSPSAADTAVVLVTSTSEPAGEWVTLVETGANTSRFQGGILVATGAPAPDGRVQVAHGDVLTVSYFDGDDGSGRTTTAFATAALDCAGPKVGGIAVGALTHARGTVQYTTSEPANTVIEYGPTPALGRTHTVAALTTYHDGVINQGRICGDMYFRVRATDAYGNSAVADDNGAPFRVHTWNIPGLYWMDDFENSSGWTLDGEWGVAAPAGRGGSSGPPDPVGAYNNDLALGVDLAGTGAYPGDYEPNVMAQVARTPVLDATAWRNTKLLFQRRLQAATADEPSILTYGKGGQKYLWRTSGAAVVDQDWTRITHDVADAFDGQTQVALEFRQHSDGANQRAGWTLDDVILKDGALPDLAPCGQCQAPPAFAGARAAVDDDACGAGGVTVSWDAAVAWGSGTTGTYAVYRGTEPGFPADAAHRVASGVAALSWTDAAAPAGALSYLVRAENDETCAAGPQNHGVTDANAVYVPVVETTTRPVPSEVTGLTVGLVARTHVRLQWTAAANATGFAAYRSPQPNPTTFGLLGRTAGLVHDDLGAGASSETYFYLVRGTNPCGVEGP